MDKSILEIAGGSALPSALLVDSSLDLLFVVFVESFCFSESKSDRDDLS